MTQDNARTWIHQDVEITVDEMGRFSYTLDEQGQYHGTLSAAQEAITSYKLAQARTETISLECLTSSGEPFVIRGIHLGTSNVLTTPTKLGGGEVYIDSSFIRVMLGRINALEAEAAVIRSKLRNATIHTVFGYGRMRPEDFGAAMERLLARYEEATEHAKTLEQSDAQV